MFDNYKKQEFETRGESVGNVLNSMFSFKNGDWKGVGLFILTLALFGWTIDSLLPIFHDLILWVLYFQPKTFNPSEEFIKHFLKLLFPLIIFIATILISYRYRRRNLAPIEYEAMNSKPRKCFVYMLSIYNERNKLLLKDLMKKVDENTLELNEVFADTNWGQLAFTVAFHAPVLEKCVIVTTLEASKFYVEAEKLVKYIVKKQTNNTIECDEEKIGDKAEHSNDIGRVANKIKNLFQDLEKEDFLTEDIVANITGGNSAMTGGMILATLDENVNVEYVRQDIPLTAELLKDNSIMLAPKTTYKLVK